MKLCYSYKKIIKYFQASVIFFNVQVLLVDFWYNRIHNVRFAHVFCVSFFIRVEQ